ncbi:ionotropic receptor 21a [Battus philenor]|uniref:ionotropic receptor 21a n=1 Tax=Battus philenor TaxID=42288 RepID=UPI0035CF7EC5
MLGLSRLLISFNLIIINVFCNHIEYYASKSPSFTRRLSYNSENKFNQKESYYSDTYNIINKNDFKCDNYKKEILQETNTKTAEGPKKRAVNPIFHGYSKTKEELWSERFLNESSEFDQATSLIKLLHNITMRYLNDCTPVILYGNEVKSKESYLIQNFLKDYPVSYIHGYIEDNDKLNEPKLLEANSKCLHFIVFINELKRVAKVLGKQSKSKVIVVARSSQWAIHEFLASSLSRIFVNLLVIGQSFKEVDNHKAETPFILYTHKLYVDGLGASKSIAIDFWYRGKFSKDVNLFPPKMTKGYAGHRFIVAAANQPPFTFRRIKTDSDDRNPKVIWDGIEIRLLNVLAERNNFSIEIVEPRDLDLGPGDAVVREVIMDRADIAVAGIYVTSERIGKVDLSYAHSQDCAAFITLMSTALPRYRAILGPFHWHVWLALTFIYLIGIFPLAFSDKQTLRHLINNSGEVENMFWYVFGTFTNCFTFVGVNSWSKTTKITTRLLIGWYWVFTIIITSCYTGCIIAFVTLPIFPESVDSVKQLLTGFFRVGTLDRGGWERWFYNSSDSDTNKLLKKLEFVPDVKSGIKNITKAFFWPYAFLGSHAELQYIVQANFTEISSKRSVLHISNECFVPFGVALGFPLNSVYREKLSGDVQRMLQSGIIDKIIDEVRWEIQRNSFGRLSVGKESRRVHSVEERGLTLEDTQGMFLLLGAGFLIAAGALISEWMGGCSRKCTFKRKRRVLTAINSKENLIPDTNDINEVESDHMLHFKTSFGSSETLESAVKVSVESIFVHDEYNVHEMSSHPSSADVDREVKDIFERDQQRKCVMLNSNRDMFEEKADKIFSSI